MGMLSYHLYNKTRPAASRESVQRAKALLGECGGPAQLQGLIHPAFRDDERTSLGDQSQVRGIGSVSSDSKSLAFIQELRGYRPKAEKVGNVISVTATRVMEQAKSDVSVTAAAKEAGEAEFESV